MSNGKKKMGPLAWVLIGCLGLIILSGLAFTTCGFFAAKKLKDVAGDYAENFSENPAMAAAELMVRANPEMELVESDPDAQTLTIRNKETGEIATVDLSEIQEGKFSFESPDGEDMSIDFGGDEGQLVTIEDKDGEKAMQLGSSGDIPAWVPLYPGTEPEGLFSFSAGGERSGTFRITTGDSIAEVLEYYEDALADLAMPVSKSTYSTPDGQGATLTTTGGEGESSLNLMIAQGDGATEVTVSFRQPAG